MHGESATQEARKDDHLSPQFRDQPGQYSKTSSQQQQIILRDNFTINRLEFRSPVSGLVLYTFTQMYPNLKPSTIAIFHTSVTHQALEMKIK
jgi:hypothetical protein